MTLQDPTIAGWASTFSAYAVDWGEVGAGTERLSANWMDLFNEASARQELLILGGAWWSGPRSLLGVIGQRHLEQVHSSILAWLLDPNGRHGLGRRFLARFLACCELPSEWADVRVRVVTEEGCVHPELSDRYGLADVVLRGPEWTLVIENKLWAGQHGDQLDLYYDAYLPTGAKFVYLTPEGVQARSTRPEVVAAFRVASWRRHVLPELRCAIGEAEASGETCLVARDYVVALEEELP